MKAITSFLIVSVAMAFCFGAAWFVDAANRKGYGIEWFVFPGIFLAGWGVLYSSMVESERRRKPPTEGK